eukprot:COSAG02_NODE_904_length_16045_cov_3920.854697_19_plen_249_part_00
MYPVESAPAEVRGVEPPMAAASSSKEQWRAFLVQLVSTNDRNVLTPRTAFAALREQFGEDVKPEHRVWCKDTVRAISDAHDQCAAQGSRNKRGNPVLLSSSDSDDDVPLVNPSTGVARDNAEAMRKQQKAPSEEKDVLPADMEIEAPTNSGASPSSVNPSTTVVRDNAEAMRKKQEEELREQRRIQAKKWAESRNKQQVPDMPPNQVVMADHGKQAERDGAVESQAVNLADSSEAESDDRQRLSRLRL